MKEVASNGERPKTLVSMKQTTPFLISLKNSVYRPARSSSKYHLYDMCSQIDSFSSQPESKAFMRPTSIGMSPKFSEILYIDSFVSWSVDAATAV